MRSALLILIVLWLPAGQAGDLSLMQWQRDLKQVRESVMMPLRAELETQNPAPAWREYVNPFLKSLRHTQMELDPISYQIIRDIMLGLTEDFERFSQSLSWQDAELYTFTKLDLAGNIVSRLDD